MWRKELTRIWGGPVPARWKWRVARVENTGSVVGVEVWRNQKRTKKFGGVRRAASKAK